MRLEARVKSQTAEKRPQEVKPYLDTIPGEMGFILGTAMSGGDPEVGHDFGTAFYSLATRIQNYFSKRPKTPSN